MPATGRYIADTNIFDEFGTQNCNAWADLDGDGDATKISNRIQRAINVAEDRFDSAFRTSVYLIPLQPLGPINDVVSLIAQLAGIWLYECRGLRDKETTTTKMDARKKAVIEQLDEILAAKVHINCTRKPIGGVEVPRVGGGPRFMYSVARGEGFSMFWGDPLSADGQQSGTWPGTWR